MFNLDGVSNLAVLPYATRVCYQSFSKLDGFGDNDRRLMRMIVNKNHYSPLNMLWFKFSNFENDTYLQWIYDNRVVQRYVTYNPRSHTLLVNARTLKETSGDYISDRMIDLVRPHVPVIFGDTDDNLTIRSDIIEPLETVDSVRIIDRFDNKVFFELNGISRALLQQFIRHYSFPLVKSTRYTLKELTVYKQFSQIPYDQYLSVVNSDTIDQLRTVWLQLTKGMSNDRVKPLLPECYRTHVIAVMDIDDLEHMLNVRSGSHVYFEWSSWVNKLRFALVMNEGGFTNE